MNSVPLGEFTKRTVEELNDTIVILDLETTGFSKYNDRIVEFGAIKMKNSKIVEEMSVLINPGFLIPESVIEVHGINNKMVEGKPTEEYYVPKIKEFIKDSKYIIGHNVSFDVGFIEEMFSRNGEYLKCTYIDTMKFVRRLYKGLENYKLGTVAKYFGIEVKVAHRALADVMTTLELLKIIAYRTKNS